MPKRAALLFLLLAAGPGRAGEEADGQASYTAAELAALDVALHAANLDRIDLTFRKDLTEGKACLPVVRAMLRDPLQIAPEIDAFAALTEPASCAGVGPLP